MTTELATTPWSSCPSSHAAEPGRSGNDLPCCVHAADDSGGSLERHVSLFCCWCGTALVVESADAIPPRTASARRHGPVGRGCRPARRADLAAPRRR